MDGISVDNIIDVFNSINSRNKKKLYLFLRNEMVYVNYIYNVLSSGNYNYPVYNIFLIRYPKYRVVMSLNMVDKVINHYIARYVLIPKLSKYLDYRNVATRIGMGTSYGIRLLKRYIEFNKKYGNFYVLKLDIKKYFYNIDHDILKGMLGILSSTEYKLISTIIDSTNFKYINDSIFKLKCNERNIGRKDEIDDIPLYKYGKGLPIGNMTSQFLSIFYLYKLDHFIIHDLKLKYMVRYMDDYVLIHNSKDYLCSCLDIIKNKLINEYKLDINIKKSRIYSIYDGFNFLGYRFRVINKKTIISISKNSCRNVLLNIKRNISNYSNDNYCYFYNSISNYYNSFVFCNSFIVKNYIYKSI